MRETGPCDGHKTLSFKMLSASVLLSSFEWLDLFGSTILYGAIQCYHSSFKTATKILPLCFMMS